MKKEIDKMLTHIDNRICILKTRIIDFDRKLLICDSCNSDEFQYCLRQINAYLYVIDELEDLKDFIIDEFKEESEMLEDEE